MKTYNYIFFLTSILLLPFVAHAQIITTIAGDSTAGYNGDGIPAISAELLQPIGIAVDGAGNVYISDRDNNRIRKVNTSGIIITIAGNGLPGYAGDNGLATDAKINYPYGVTVDEDGNVYFADNNNSCVRKVNTSGIITTIAGNNTAGYNGDNIPATTAELNGPAGVAVDGSGNVYIADALNNRIRKVNTSGIITTIAGTGASIDSGDNGLAVASGIYGPYSITLDATNNIYVGEQSGHRVRKINISGIISTVAGTDTGGDSGDGGLATVAELSHALGLAVDESGNLFISDENNNRIRKVDPSGIITTYAGTGFAGYSGDNGLALSAELFGPASLAIDGAGNLYIADGGNSRIRYITSTVFVNTVKANNDKLILYPNPTRGDFAVNMTSSIEEQVCVIITNTTGEKVKELTTSTNNPLNVKLDERSGLYFISMTTTHGTQSAKLVVTQ